MERSSLEERVARIEGILEQMDKRLNHLESEVRDLRAYVVDAGGSDNNVGYNNTSNTLQIESGVV